MLTRALGHSPLLLISRHIQVTLSKYAFEEICNRFNLFLARLWKRDQDKQRGLVVMDESQYEEPLQLLARRFREEGTRLLAWAVWRRYEFHDARYFDGMVRRFDRDGGVMHGLVHRSANSLDCGCPACMSRSLRNDMQAVSMRQSTD